MTKGDFKLEHKEGKLTAIVTTEEETFEIDVTSYFETEEAIADWLFYKRKQRLNIK